MVVTVGSGPKCCPSMKNSPATMKIASGRSLPIVSTFTVRAPSRMPRMLMTVSASVMDVMMATRAQPDAAPAQ